MKVALVTGASSGIGRETARRLAARGWTLALAARRRDRLEDLAAELRAAPGGPPLALPVDIARPGAAAEMVQRTAAHFGRLDVLINNAGILRMAPFARMPGEEMREIFETNFWAPLEAIRAAIPVMTGGGHIVNVGSAVGRRALGFMAAYAASKFALTGLGEALRLELAARRITLTTVYPGGVETEMPNRLDRSRLPAGYPDHASTRISAARAARGVVRAVEKRPPEVYVPWWIRPLAWGSVLFPGVWDRLIRRSYGDIEWT